MVETRLLKNHDSTRTALAATVPETVASDQMSVPHDDACPQKPLKNETMGEGSAMADEASAMMSEASAMVDEVSAMVDEVSAMVNEASAMVDEVSAMVDEASAMVDEVTVMVNMITIYYSDGNQRSYN